MTDLAQRALRGAKATIYWQIARVVLLGLSIVVLARFLTPADFGIVAMVTAIIGMGELLRDFGLSVASIQSKTLSGPEKDNLFWLNTLVGAALTVTVFVAAYPIAALYGDHRLVSVTQALSITFLLNGFATQYKAQINRDLRFTTLGVVEAVPQALALIAATWIAVAAHSYWALVWQSLVAAAFQCVLCVALARWHPGRYRRSVPIGRFVRFGGALVGTQLLAYVSKNVDSVLLGALRGPTELGLYNRAYQIIVLPLNQVTAPLSRVAIPVLSRLQDDRAVFLEYVKAAQFATLAATSFFYGTMIGFGEPLVRLVLGAHWVGAVPILQILAVSGMFRALGQIPYWIFVTLGATGQQFTVYLIGQPIVVASIVIGVHWGATGVAAGCALGYAVFWLMNIWWVGRVANLGVARLALSGLGVVAVFAGPVAALGAAAVELANAQWGALLAASVAAVACVAAAAAGIPVYRRHIRRFVRLSRASAHPQTVTHR